MVNNKRSRRDSRAALFRAATHEFAERGYDAAGVDRIAARARVNKAMLYYHFGSKLGLYLEVLRDMFRAVGVRARALADGPGPAEAKLDTWILTIVEEAAARPWFPPIMLREIASGGPHFDPDTLALMNAVFLAVRDVIVQGQREGVFDEVDPLLTHLTVMPPILIFFARQRVVAKRKGQEAIGAPRQLDEFVRHMQRAVRRMVQKDPTYVRTKPMRTHMLLVGLALAALTACRQTEPSNLVRVSGHVEATEVQVAAEVGGRLVELRAAEGDRVAPGDVVARLDTRDVDLQIARARAERAAADAQIRLLLAGARPQDIRQAEAHVDAAGADAAAVEAELKAATIDLQRFESLLNANAGSQK